MRGTDQQPRTLAAEHETSYLRLEAVPHFVVKAGSEEQLLRDIVEEYRAFLRFLLVGRDTVADEVTLHFRGPGRGRGRSASVEIGYEISGGSDQICDYLGDARRYLRLAPASAPPSLPEPDLVLKRRVELAPVGALDKSPLSSLRLIPEDAPRGFAGYDRHKGRRELAAATAQPLSYALISPISGAHPYVAAFAVAVQVVASAIHQNFTHAYLMPLPSPLQIRNRLSPWRSTIARLARAGGAVSITCRRSVLTARDVDYASLCWEYLLGTNSDRLLSEELSAHGRMLAAVVLGQPLFDATVRCWGPSAQSADAFKRDTDPAAFEMSPTRLETQALLDDVKPPVPLERWAEEPAFDAEGNLQPPRDDPAAWPSAATTDSAPDRRSAVRHPALRYAELFSPDELVDLLFPPYTFRDAIPGARHYVPKPTREQPPCRPSAAASVTLGDTEMSGRPLDVALEDLTRHVFVTGASGSGKTNTMINIARQVHNKGCPILVMDPVKRDFEPLMEALGLRDNVIDFRRRWLQFNPFVPAKNISLYAHSVILGKTLAMLEPTNQVAYQILVSMVKHTYMRVLGRGQATLPLKDFLTLTGADLARHGRPTPTFEDFLSCSLEVVKLPEGDYVSEWDRETFEVFRRRWENLDRSALALMFQSQASGQETVEQLLRQTHLIEFGSWFDEDEANTAMALIFALLYEQRLSDFGEHGHKPGLSAVAVIDEAHRIIPATPRTGDPRLLSPGRETGEILARMLAECRSLGQGIIIGEQSASSVHANALVNTSTKVVHSVLYGPDKQCLAEGLALSEAERDYLPYLQPGEALVLTPGVYQPVQVCVPKVTYPRPTSGEA